MTDDERHDSPEEEAAAQESPAPESPEEQAPAEAGQPEEAAEAQEPAAPPAEAAEPVAEAEVPAETESPAEAEEPAEAEAPAEAEEPAAAAEEPAAETEEPAAPAEEPAAEAEAPAADEQARPSRRERNPKKGDDGETAIPGAHLEPDLVLDDPGDAERDPYAEDGDEESGAATADDAAPEPVSTTILELAADARYLATGKRKSAVARVTIKPGTGVYTVNGKELDAFFPRPTLQRTVRGPLETVGQQERLDVVAKIHGGGVSSQAGALRHGISRALVEADPNLRGELKRRGFLTRDPRVKERKKAGLKKARKRPQFSKR